MVAFYNKADQELYKNYQYLPQEQYRLGLNLPKSEQEVEAVSTNFGIPNTNAFTGGGGGGGDGYYPGSPNNLVTDYQTTVDDRQYKLGLKPSTFLGFNTMRDQQLTGADLGEYIGSNTSVPRELTAMGKAREFFTPQSAESILEDGYEEPSFQPGIIGTIMGKIDNYRNLPRYDQAFIAQNMGYTGPTIFGENKSGLSKDPFGLNTRSMFGNYGEAVEKQVNRLDDYFGGKNFAKRYGNLKLEQDEEGNWGFTGGTKKLRDKANYMNKMNLARYNYYRQKQKEREELRTEEFEKPGGTQDQVAIINKRMRDEGVTGKDYNQAANIAGGGGGNKVINTPAGPMTARQATYDNDPNTGTAQGYSPHYARGGLASIL